MVAFFIIWTVGGSVVLILSALIAQAIHDFKKPVRKGLKFADNQPEIKPGQHCERTTA